MSDEEPRDFWEKQEFERLSQILNLGALPVLVVLRLHLLTEYYLGRIIQTELPGGDGVLSDARLSYHQKLILVSSFDILDDVTLQCLRHLNKLRNECAHAYDKEITASDVERVGVPLGESFDKYKREFGKSILELLSAVLKHICSRLAAYAKIVESQRK